MMQFLSDFGNNVDDQGFNYTLEVDEDDTSDEKYKTTKDRGGGGRGGGCNTKLNELAQQPQK